MVRRLGLSQEAAPCAVGCLCSVGRIVDPISRCGIRPVCLGVQEIEIAVTAGEQHICAMMLVMEHEEGVVDSV